MTKPLTIHVADPHALDRPVWSALTTRHKSFAQGSPLAWRYPAEIGPFAAMADDSLQSWEALRKIIAHNEQLALLSIGGLALPPGLQNEPVGALYQMVAMAITNQAAIRTGSTIGSAAALVRLDEGDAADMLQLALLTKPGPFGPKTHLLGQYIGIRDQGQLVAMTGERMQFNGYTEISAVCVHPEHRGKAYARILVTTLMNEIRNRGHTPLLHVFSNNRPAISLYEELGFVLRQTFFANRIGLASEP